MTQQPHEVIWSLTNAFIPSRFLQIVAERGVADDVGDEPVSAAELAARSPISVAGVAMATFYGRFSTRCRTPGGSCSTFPTSSHPPTSSMCG